MIRGKTEITRRLSARSSPNPQSFRGSHFALFLEYRVQFPLSSPVCSLQKGEDFHWANLCLLFLVKMRQHSDTDEQVCEEEDSVQCHPGDTDTSDECDEEVHRCCSGTGCPETQMLQPWSDSCRAHRAHEHSVHASILLIQSCLHTIHRPTEATCLWKTEESGLSKQEGQKDRWSVSTARNISARNTLKVFILATHASKHQHLQTHWDMHVRAHKDFYSVHIYIYIYM